MNEKPSILIVDDDDVLRDRLVRAFQDRGFETRGANDFDTALKADDLVSHRMRYYTNPLNDVEGYLHSQKGGGTTKYVKPEDRK